MHKPTLLDKCYITEQLTDPEIFHFHESVECYFNGFVETCDCIIAMDINPAVWEAVWNYIYDLEDYYDKEDGDAEQDS